VSGGQAEHGHTAAGDDLHAHDGAQQRRLAAAARPEHAGHRASFEREAHALEHFSSTTSHVEVVHRDG